MEASNLTSNFSGVMRHGRRSTKSLDFAIPYTAASGIFSFVSGVSNLFVVFLLLKYVRLKQNTYVYMLSLFLSDILYNCVVQPNVCYYQFPSAVVTQFGMKYIHAASLFCILIGTLSLFFASFDKYIFIAHPFFYGNYITKKKTRAFVLCIWLACLVLGVMRFYEMASIKDYYLTLVAASFLLTILVQIMIFVVAREQDKRIHQLHRSLEHNHPRYGGEANVLQPHASQTSNKAAKTIGLLLAVYIMSWLPVNIYRQEYRWNGGDRVLYHKWIKIINLMIQLHSCINPFIFVLRSKDMKNAIAKVLRGVRHGLGEERNSQVIISSDGNILTATTRGSNASGIAYNDNGQNGNIQGEHEGHEISGSTANEELGGGQVNNSYRSSLGNIASRNTTDGANSDNGQNGNIQGEHEGHEISGSTANEELGGGQVNNSYRSSLGNIASRNTTDGANSDNGQNGNIQREHEGHEVSGSTANEELGGGQVNNSYRSSFGNIASRNTTDGANNENGQNGNIQREHERHEMSGGTANEELGGGQVSNSYRNSFERIAGRNTTDGANNDNGQSGNIQRGNEEYGILSEEIGGQVSNSYRNPYGNNANESSTDGANNDNGQSGNIQKEHVDTVQTTKI